MMAIEGYYDGISIKPLERVQAKPNQRVVITFMDELIEPINAPEKKGIRGVLAEYANPELRDREKDAWGQAMVEKHGDV